MRSAVGVDPLHQLDQLGVGRFGGDGSIGGTTRRSDRTAMWQMCEEKRFAGRLKLLEYRDSARGGLSDHPRRRDAGGIAFTLERETGDLPPISPSIRILLGRQAAATQVFNFAVTHAGEERDQDVAADLQ